MKRILHWILGSTLLFSCSTKDQEISGTQAEPARNVRAVYFTEWGVYGREYGVEKIPFDKVSHILYAFIGICGNNESLKAVQPGPYETLVKECAQKKRHEITIHDTWAALNAPNDNFKKLAAKKAQNPSVKILASIGGWSLSDPFFELAATPQTRAVFINSVMRFLDTYKFFDGIDIDWEYPGGNGVNKALGSSVDRANHLALMRELRSALDAKGRGYLLTSAVGAGPKMIGNVDYKALFNGNRPILDLVFAMTYDFYGAWNGERGHTAGVYPGANLVSGFSTQEAIDNLIYSGVPANRLAVGVAGYGRAWENVKATHDSGLSKNAKDVSGSALSADAGMWDAGVIDYKLIESRYAKDNSFTYKYDRYSQAPFLYAKDKGVFITYENKCSAQAKIDLAKNRGLAGSFMWSIDSDNGDLINVMNGQKPSSKDCPCVKQEIPDMAPSLGQGKPNETREDVELGDGVCFAGFGSKKSVDHDENDDTNESTHKDPPTWNDRRLDQVTFLTAHNAFANMGDGSAYIAYNQKWGIEEQLEKGVRGLMIDLYTSKDGEAIVCHGICGAAGSFPWVSFTDELKRIEKFMYKDPNAIVTLHIEAGRDPTSAALSSITGAKKLTSKSAIASFNAFPGLKSWIFNPEEWKVKDKGWPKIGEMIKANKRLIVFSQFMDDDLRKLGWAHDMEYTVENYWSMGSGADITPDPECKTRWTEVPLNKREDKFRRLFVMNHFLDVPDILTSDTINRHDHLWGRISGECLEASGRIPNFIALDFVDQGSGREAVIDLNEKARGIAFENKDFSGKATLIMRGKDLDQGSSFKSKDNSISSIDVFFEGTRMSLFDGENFEKKLRDINKSNADLKADAKKISSIEAF